MFGSRRNRCAGAPRLFYADCDGIAVRTSPRRVWPASAAEGNLLVGPANAVSPYVESRL
jgi:hypothetical protein